MSKGPRPAGSRQPARGRLTPRMRSRSVSPGGCGRRASNRTLDPSTDWTWEGRGGWYRCMQHSACLSVLLVARSPSHRTAQHHPRSVTPTPRGVARFVGTCSTRPRLSAPKTAGSCLELRAAPPRPDMRDPCPLDENIDRWGVLRRGARCCPCQCMPAPALSLAAYLTLPNDLVCADTL